MSCCLCRLFTLDCLKKIAGIKSYNDDLLFYTAEKLAYDRQVKPLVGEACYDELCVAKSTDALTPIQQQLIDKIKPFAGWAIKYYFLLNRALEIEPSGNYARTEGSNYADRAVGNDSVMSACADNMEFYKADVKAFLEANAVDFPCYVPDPTECGDETKPTGYYTGITTW